MAWSHGPYPWCYFLLKYKVLDLRIWMSNSVGPRSAKKSHICGFYTYLLGMIVIHLLRDVVFHLNLGCKKNSWTKDVKKPCKLFNGINFHTHADQHYHHPIIDHFRHFPLAHTGSRARRKWLHRFRMRRVCTPHAMRSLMKKQRCWKFNHVLVMAKVAWGTKNSRGYWFFSLVSKLTP